MPLLARVMFGLVNFAARRGLSDSESARAAAPRDSVSQAKRAARRTGVRGETYAYWFLRRHGYVLVARNYTRSGVKGEIDLVGYDGAVLAFIEVKTRAAEKNFRALPEDSITPAKQRALARIARSFLSERRATEAPWRFDVLALETTPGRRPVVRLHKGAFALRPHSP
ncbi:MAG: YraN family protein [Candidatus Acidiferrales bacterium]